MFRFYFAYGSNLHPLRLLERVPSVEFVQLVTVPGYRLQFHKRHEEDGSGKCNMFHTGSAEDIVIGALYSMERDHKSLLDQYEGPGYRCDELELEVNNQQLTCFVYVAEQTHIDDRLLPYDWYRSLVLLGARYHGLPEDYVGRIIKVKTRRDPDVDRQRKNETLIAKMKTFPSP